MTAPLQIAANSYNGIVNVKEFGAKGDNSTNDTAAIQAAINACFGDPRTTAATAYLNKRLFFPPGRYIINDELDCHNLYGFQILGASRLSSKIIQTTANKAIFNLDAAAYGEIRSLLLAANGQASTTKGLLHLDYTGTYTGLKPQQLTFADLTIDGTSSYDVGMWICKSGGSAQGDTILISNVFIQTCNVAGIEVGSVTDSATNALSIVIHGGNIQGCSKRGILVYGGSVFVDGTSFQSQGSSGAQLKADTYDIEIVNSFSVSSASNIRSEGALLAKGSIVVDNSETYSADFLAWAASTAYTRGSFIHGTPETVKTDGRGYICMTAGTSSGTEPDWLADGGGGFAPAATVATTGSSTTVTSSDAFLASMVGQGIWIAGAGTAGADHYTTIASFVNIGEITLTVAPATTVAAARWRTAPLVDDGTAKWMHWEFNAVDVATVRDTRLLYGRIKTGHGGMAAGNIVTRPDFIDPAAYTNFVAGDYATGTVWAHNKVIHGGINAVEIDYGMWPGADGTYPLGSYRSARPFAIGNSPLLFEGGDQSVAFPSVGFDRGDGVNRADFAAGTATDLSRNIVAAIGTLGRKTRRGTNQVGEDLLIQGGLGTGSGGGGKVSVRTQPVAGSGTTITSAEEVARFDNSTTAGDSRFWLYDASAGSLVRVKIGASGTGPGGSGKMLYVS